jgi:hypothetical protein
MATLARRRAVAALLIAAVVVEIGATGALAQEYAGSAITSGGATVDEVSGVLTLAPGVTINDGDVSNETGIGVVISGGTSAGTAPGGGSDTSVVE